MTEASDYRFMARALQLAQRAIASADPNPAVGCVVVREGGIVGEGFTQRAGGNHAEIEALNAAGAASAGSTVYVSLEPCAHIGRTGPCARALVDAGVARVVFAVEDPNPAVAGKGASLLAAAGVVTESPLLARQAENLNRGFFSRMRRRRPWVRCKMAASLDGRTAMASGESQWITGAAARRDVHRWRARSSAVMTGIGTVLADDPALSARPADSAIDVVQPRRVVLDTLLQLPPNSKLLDGAGEVIVFTALSAEGAAVERFRALERAGARVETVAADPRCDLDVVADRLAELEVNDVWLEAGPTLAGAMLAAGLVDEFVLYLAPSLLGCAARGMFELPPIGSLADRVRLEIDDLRRVGEDIRLIARPVAA